MLDLHSFWHPPVLYILAGSGVVLLLLILWRVLGRRQRALAAAQRLLMQGAWEEALMRIRQLRPRRPGAWNDRLRSAEADCLRAGMQAAIQEKQFELALERSVQAAQALDESPDAARALVAEAMLAEIRRLFAATAAGARTAPVHDLIAQTLLVLERCQEAEFWQGLTHLRDGKIDLALSAFERARSGEGGITWSFDQFTASQPAGDVAPARRPTGFIDPPLYLGALLLRQGKGKESLRLLTEANRIDPGCPFVATQLGCAMIAAEGDAQLAVRALQRALGPRGFGQWAKQPQLAWREGLPDGRSYVRRLAKEHPYQCPLWGADLRPLLNQANLALGQGLYRLGNYQEASDVFARLLQESAPSFAVLRGLGLSLARIGQFDEAFKHLRTAHELIEERDRIVAGYLALCGAKGKPKRNEDKIRNVAWAIELINRFTAPGDEEWRHLVSAIHAEARTASMDVSADDQIYLCEHLLSVKDTSPLAADAYHHLQTTHPERMHREYAWLYCRAAEQHQLAHERGLELFAATFADAGAAGTFYQQQQWDMRGVELAYLKLAAERTPGRFPDVLGADYAARGEQLLLDHATELEQSGQLDAALAFAQAHLRLAPHSPRAFDRLAQLYYRRQLPDPAADTLRLWHESAPELPLPLLRLAALHAEQKRLDEGLACIQRALAVTQGRQRSEAAYLGARLALSHADESTAWQTAESLLIECLHGDADHVDALWLLAAVRWLRGEQAELAKQATQMQRPEVGDARFQLMAAVCHFAAGDHDRMIAACARAADLDERVAIESRFLAGWGHWLRGDHAAARRAFALVADAESSPSRHHAQALLGHVAFMERDYETAAAQWNGLPASARGEWQLVQPLAGAIFLGALQNLHAGRCQQAAQEIREAGKLGWRDRRLGALLTLALVKAGQQALE